MGKENKEKEQLIHELAELRQQVDELKKAEAKRLSAGQAGKRAEEKLKQKTEQQEVLLSSIPAFIYFKDSALKLIAANKAFAEMVHTPIDQLPGKDAYDLFPKEEAEKFHGDDKKVMESGKPMMNIEEEFTDAEGKTRWASTSKVPYFDEKGQVAGMVGITIDITNRKRAEEGIKRQKERAEEYLNIAGIMLATVDADENITLINKKGCQILGYEESEFIGKNWFDLLVPREIRAEVRGVFRKLMAGDIEPVEHYENPLLTKDGEERIIAFHNTVIREPNGQIIGALFSGADITERKRAEEEIRQLSQFQESIIDNANVWMDVLNEDFSIRLWNRAAEQISGYSREEVVGHSKIWEWLYPDDAYRKEVTEKVAAILERGKVDENLETTIRNKDGETRIITWNVRSMSGEARKSGEFIVIGRDITERKRTEEALRETNHQIERLHEAAYRVEACETEGHVYQLTVETAEKILSFTRCTLYTVEGDRIVVKATLPELPPRASRESHLDEGGLAALTYRTGKTYVFSSPDEVPEAGLTDPTLKSGISVPIGDIGVFQVVSTKRNAFTQDHARLLELLVGHTAEALKRIRLEGELKQQAMCDHLTGVYNRRYFTQVIEKEIERSKRYDHSIGLLMIDVNRFKEINDRFGHQIGDRVLQEVAKLLKEQVRKVDIVVRYGGDEFLVVLPETNGATEAIVERIHNAVAKWNEENPIIEFPITLAIGKSYWRPESTETIETILHKADQQMYEDKKRHGTGDQSG